MAPPPCSAKLQSWLQRDHFAELVSWDNLPSAPEIAHSMAPPPYSAKLQSWLQRDHFAELAPWDACAQIHRRLSKYFYYLGCQTH